MVAVMKRETIQPEYLRPRLLRRENDSHDLIAELHCGFNQLFHEKPL